MRAINKEAINISLFKLAYLHQKQLMQSIQYSNTTLEFKDSVPKHQLSIMLSVKEQHQQFNAFAQITKNLNLRHLYQVQSAMVQNIDSLSISTLGQTKHSWVSLMETFAKDLHFPGNPLSCQNSPLVRPIMVLLALIFLFMAITVIIQVLSPSYLSF